jgi:probable F420-dependent oxidoreductase
VKFSFPLPTCTEGLNQPPGSIGPEDIVDLARDAERLGFDAVWANDHLAPWPALRADDPSPYNWYDVLISLACCARATSTIRLGLGVVVVPYREPVVLAKQVATLDTFSGGRVMFGVGIGTQRAEFEALSPGRPKANRGRMLDEMLAAVDLLFNEPVASFDGEYYAFEGVALAPKPVQSPLPVYVSGKIDAAFDRAARYGAGLMILGGSPENVAERVNGLGAALDKVGRDISEIDIVACPAISLDSIYERAVERFLGTPVGHRFTSWTNSSGEVEAMINQQMIGTPEDIAERVVSWAEAGMTHFAPQHIAAHTAADMSGQMHRFAEEVIPLCRSA